MLIEIDETGYILPLLIAKSKGNKSENRRNYDEKFSNTKQQGKTGNSNPTKMIQFFRINGQQIRQSIAKRKNWLQKVYQSTREPDQSPIFSLNTSGKN